MTQSDVMYRQEMPNEDQISNKGLSPCKVVYNFTRILNVILNSCYKKSKNDENSLVPI